MGLKKNGYHVDAIEINQLSIDYAIKHNIIDRGSTFDIDYIKEADIIISGLYPNMTVDWITTYQKYFKPGALITDVSSVKTGVVEPIQKIIRRDVELNSQTIPSSILPTSLFCPQKAIRRKQLRPCASLPKYSDSVTSPS